MHFMQSGNGRRRVIGVDGGKNEMAGHRGFHCDLGRFLVADFSDHDDIGVLAEKRPKGFGESEPDLRVNVGLNDPRQVVLHGIFGGQNLRIGIIDGVQGRVERRGFP